MPELNEYDALLVQDEDQRKQALRATMVDAQRQNPDQYAQAKKLAPVAGVPAPVVAQHLDETRQQANLNEYDALLEKSPVLAKQLVDPDFAAVAHDDTEALHAVERSVAASLVGLSERLQRIGQVGKAAARAGAAGTTFDFGAAAYGWLEGAAKSIAEKQVPGAESLPGIAEVAKYLETRRVSAEALAQAVAGPTPDNLETVEAGVVSGVRSTGQMLPSLLLSVITGNPQPALATAGVMAGGQAVTKGLKGGLSPDQALLYGLEDATAEVATEMIPIARFLKDVKAGAPFLKILAQQAIREVPTEMAATAWQNFNEHANLHPDQPFSSYLEALPEAEAQTIVATLTMTLATAGTGRIVTELTGAAAKEQERAAAAESAAKAHAEIMQTVAATKMVARDQSGLQTYLQALTEDGPLEDVWLNPAELMQQGVDTGALAKLSPSFAAQLTDAIVHKGDIKVPTAELAIVAQGSGLEEAIIQNLRTAPGEMSQREAQVYAQKGLEGFDAEVQAAAENIDFQAAFRESRATVEKELLAQLNTAGRFTEDVNAVSAKMMASVYATEAQRMGLTPEEMYVKYPLHIRSEGVTEGVLMPQGSAADYRALSKTIKEVQAGKVDPATIAHESTSAAVASMLAKELGLEKERTADIVLAALAHDVGKSQIPTEVLLADRRLTDAEFEQVKAHPQTGYNMLKKAGIPERIAEIALHHHRGFKEGGYPAATAGEYLTFASQILHVADVVAAVGKADPAHPYVTDAGVEKALNLLEAEPTKFNPEIVAAFKKLAAEGRLPRAFRQGAVRDLPSHLHSLARKHFGSTLDPREAGYIFEHGPKLDLSGRHEASGYENVGTASRPRYRPVAGQPDYLAGQRSTDHRDLSEEIYDALGVTDPVGAMIGFQRHTRAIRFDSNAGISAPFQPTREHIEAVVRAWKYVNGQESMYVDADDPVSGNTIASAEIEKPTVDKVYKFFKDAFAAKTYSQSVSRITAGGLTFPVVENPPRGVAANLAERATDGRVRAYRDASGNLFVWDASKAIHNEVATEMGIPRSEQGTMTRFEWSAEEVRNAPQQIFSGEANSYRQAGDRGTISFPVSGIGKGPTTITLTKNADLSTFLHEMGHFANEMLFDLASQPEAPQQLVSDAQTLLNWLGLLNWTATPQEQKTLAHEQLARSFESYLFEGKAPSPELTSVFQRIASWLKAVYRAIIGINAAHKQQTGVDLIPLTDEVRGVFDRMLATDAEIAARKAENEVKALFSDAAQAGMTEAEWQAYQAAAIEPIDEAMQILQARAIGDMRWLSGAKGRVLKAMQKDAKAKRDAVEREVTAEVRSEPIYAALRFLRTGEIRDPEGGIAQAESFKLDTATVLAEYPELKGVLNNTLRGLTGPDGLSPDFVAEQFGLSSGDELIRRLVEGAVPPEADVIQERTDQRVLERYGDLTTPEAIARAADAALSNDAHTRFVATEMRALSRAAGDKRVQAAAAKELAEGMIANRKIRDVKPGAFAVADRRNGREAEDAFKKGDIPAAAAAKRNQLVAAYATKAAHAAQSEVEKGLRYLRDIADSKSLPPGYRQQIAQLLAKYNLRPMTNKEIERAKSLLEWAAEQEAEGLQPVIDPAILAEARQKPVKEMTVQEFRGLFDTVKNIAHLGRLKQRLLTAADERTFAEHVDTAAQSINDNATATLPERIERNTWLDRARGGVNEFFAMHRKFASYLRQMDGFKDGGVMWQLFGREMNRAGDTEAVMREQATVKFIELSKLLKDGGRMTKKMYIPQIGKSLSREGRIAVALNTGNEGNLQRLRDGDRWTDEQIKAIRDTLTKKEMDFVQGVWDLLDEYRSLIGAQQERLTGLTPEWVEPTPFETPHGTYRGGYFPAKYDTDRSTRSLSLEAAQGVMDQWRAKLGSPTTRKGFTKERARQVTDRPLRKDLGVVTQHLSEVTHRLAWQDYLTDANRLLRAGPIDQAIREHYGPEALASMRRAVEDIAAGEIGAQNAFEASVNYLRHGATIVGLGYRLTTAMLQPFGLTQSMVRIGPKWVAKGMAEWLGDAAKMENTAKRIFEKSGMMRLRSKTLQREISEIRNTISGRSSALEASYFYMITKLQLVADIPTWLGEYHKAVEQGADEATAVARADQAVLDSQGGGAVKDLSQIQRGGPMLKLFTNFYSFFNTTYNLTAESIQRTNFKDPFSVGRLGVDMLLLYVLPAVLGTLMKAALKGEDDEEKLAKQLFVDQMQYLLGTMVGLREIAGGFNALTGLPGGDYQGPAGLRFITELGKLSKQVSQGEVDDAAFKAALNVGGILFHFPTGQVENTLLGIKALANGDTENPGALIVGPVPKR